MRTSISPAAPAADPLHAARERAIRVLTDHRADDSLSEAEFGARLDRLVAARDVAAVDAVVRDLVDPAAPRSAPTEIPDERRILAVMGETHRRGWWAVPRLLRVRAVMAEVRLDLREVALAHDCVFDVRAWMSRVTVVVPPRVAVALDVFAMMGNATSQAGDRVPGDTGIPQIRVTGSAVLGEIRVLVRERGA